MKKFFKYQYIIIGIGIISCLLINQVFRVADGRGGSMGVLQSNLLKYFSSKEDNMGILSENVFPKEIDSYSQSLANLMRENLDLLAIRYNVSPKILVSALYEYYLLTGGYEYAFSPKDYGIELDFEAPEEKISIVKALVAVGEKYELSPKLLAHIIISLKYFDTYDELLEIKDDNSLIEEDHGYEYDEYY